MQMLVFTNIYIYIFESDNTDQRLYYYSVIEK